MASGYEQRDERECRRSLRKQRREEVAFQVMHADDRNPERLGEPASERCADEQGAGESRTFGVANTREVLDLSFRIFEDLPGERYQSPDVVPRSQLGNDPAVGFVHGHLGMHRLAEEPPVVQGDPGFVARGLDSEHREGMGHSGILIQFAPLFVTERRS